MNDDEHVDDALTGVWPGWIERWVMPYVAESGLWPVLAALLGHVVLVIAPVLLGLWRGNPAMALPLTVMIMISVWIIRTEWAGYGRPARASVVVGLTWCAAVVLAYVGDRTDLL